MLERNQKGGGDLPDEKIIEVFKMQLAKVYKWIADHQNFKMLEVNYNDMLKTPEPVVARINEFLDGNMNTAAMLNVIDPTLYRNRMA